MCGFSITFIWVISFEGLMSYSDDLWGHALLNKNINFDKNETESKMENATQF